MLLCQDVEIAADADDARQRANRGEVPLGTIAEVVAASQGMPLPTGGVGNVQVEPKEQKVEKTYFRASGKDAFVCGVELCLIHPKKDAKGREEKLDLSDKKPTAPPGSRLGPRDQADDPQDWVLEERIADEEWDLLLDDYAGEREEQ